VDSSQPSGALSRIVRQRWKEQEPEAW